jgi:mRNA interferase MazF
MQYMKTEAGEVYLVDLGMSAKVRPMVVISRRDDDAPRALSICAPITTSFRGSRYEIPIGKPGFLHEGSYVNVQGLQAIQHHELGRLIGHLPASAMLLIRECLAWLFEIGNSSSDDNDVLR